MQLSTYLSLAIKNSYKSARFVFLAKLARILVQVINFLLTMLGYVVVENMRLIFENFYFKAFAQVTARESILPRIV